MITAEHCSNEAAPYDIVNEIWVLVVNKVLSRGCWTCVEETNSDIHMHVNPFVNRS